MKTSPKGGGGKVLVCKTGWVGEGVVLFTSKSNNLSLILAMSIADFKLLTHKRYSVFNGLIVRQIHPSSLSNNDKYISRFVT